ncbi:MAG: HAD-IB family phosphatase [Longimicrobiales bacterium]
MRPRERFGTVIFDCDATLSEIEGIEELGREHRAEVEALTDAAMSGQLPLEQVYGRRLELARPDRERVLAVGQLYVDRIVPDTLGVVTALRAHGVDVRIVSSGVLPAVLVLSRMLGLPDDRVAAVDLHFSDDGRYEGYDPTSPLAASGGKVRAIQEWGSALRRPVMMVGDGATDLETRPVVDLFVAFAGVAARPRVMAAADVVIHQRSLAPVLPLALESPPRDEPARSLYQRGLSMLKSNDRNDA